MTSDGFVESSVVVSLVFSFFYYFIYLFIYFFGGGGDGRGFIPAKYMFLSQAPEKVLSWCENRHESLS